ARADGGGCRRTGDDAQRRTCQAARPAGQGRHGARHPRELQRLSRLAVIGPTPLVDFFKRGDVERDVRLLAAQGALAPRAFEQLAILLLLLEDSDSEIRTIANETLDRIPVEALQTFLAQPDI